MRISSRNALPSAERRLPRPAGPFASEFREPLRTFASVLLTKNASATFLSWTPSASTSWEPSTPTSSNDSLHPSSSLQALSFSNDHTPPFLHTADRFFIASPLLLRQNTSKRLNIQQRAHPSACSNQISRTVWKEAESKVIVVIKQTFGEEE